MSEREVSGPFIKTAVGYYHNGMRCWNDQDVYSIEEKYKQICDIKLANHDMWLNFSFDACSRSNEDQQSETIRGQTGAKQFYELICLKGEKLAL